jgi:hypothetical protein
MEKSKSYIERKDKHYNLRFVNAYQSKEDRRAKYCMLRTLFSLNAKLARQLRDYRRNTLIASLHSMNIRGVLNPDKGELLMHIEVKQIEKGLSKTLDTISSKEERET